jgi:hypothetical protein
MCPQREAPLSQASHATRRDSVHYRSSLQLTRLVGCDVKLSLRSFHNPYILCPHPKLPQYSRASRHQAKSAVRTLDKNHWQVVLDHLHSFIHQAAAPLLPFPTQFLQLFTARPTRTNTHNQCNGVRSGPEHAHRRPGPMVCLQQDALDRHWRAVEQR